MNDQQPCDETLSGTIQSSSQGDQIAPQGESGKSGKKRQQRQYEIESDEDEQLTRFQPFDLKSLTFKPIGENQEVDVWHASAVQFHGYISQYARGFGKVNTNIWPLAERLGVLNILWERCQEIGYPFPFAEHQQVVPNVDATPVPNVDESASEATGG